MDERMEATAPSKYCIGHVVTHLRLVALLTNFGQFVAYHLTDILNDHGMFLESTSSVQAQPLDFRSVHSNTDNLTAHSNGYETIIETSK